MSRYQERLTECLEYKKFLDDLTPSDWLEEQKQVKRQRQMQRKKVKWESLMREWQDRKARAEAELAEKEKAIKEKAEREGRSLKAIKDLLV